MKSDYKAIKGVGSGRGRFQVAMRLRLYEGPDHLLLVQSTGYTEEYKRVFYRDIRYVVARKDHSRERIGFLSGALFAATLLLLVTPTSKVLVVGLSLPFLIWFLLNLVLGPSCRTYINTDVQTLELPVPRRLNRLPKFIAYLNTKISAEQPKVEQAAA